jgi:uncharacterized protein YbaR (Trm112 family)
MSHEDDTQRPDSTSIDEELLSLLVCPACHQPVEQQRDVLRCKGCGLGYPIKDGIPVMLIDEALPPASGDQEGEQGPPAASQQVQ